jgi:acyl carrier protein
VNGMFDEIWVRLQGYLASSLGLESESSVLDIDSRIREDLGLSSLKTVELIITLEDHFDISVADDELETLVTLRDVVELIDRKISPTQG